MKNHVTFFYLNPENHYVEVKESAIHGRGLFSRKTIAKGFVLGPAMVDKSVATSYTDNLADSYNDYGDEDDNWQQVSGTRYLNHSANPNIRFIFDGRFILAVTCKEIAVDDEITVNYADYFTHTHLTLPKFLRRKKAA